MALSEDSNTGKLVMKFHYGGTAETGTVTVVRILSHRPGRSLW